MTTWRAAASFASQHLTLAHDAHARGELLLAGALADPVDRALLVFRAAGSAAVEDFARRDPYVTNGLVKRWEVRPWTVVIGNDPAEPRRRHACAGRPMIARRWSARATRDNATRYADYFRETLTPHLRELPGLPGRDAARARRRATRSRSSCHHVVGVDGSHSRLCRR